jgi:1-deoxy-D-xylulose-5-phosphate synthase
MAEADERLVGITPAMREGSGMVEFHKRFPKRYHDVGIAEQHAVTFAAGLACEGLKPVVAIYSTFLQRGYDQLIHDVAMQNLPVVFALDRAGLVGADGATHAGAYDIAYLRCIPTCSVLTPGDENECRMALTTAFRADHPVAVRYPRGSRRRRGRRPGLTTWPWGQGRGAAGAARRAHRHPGLRHAAAPGAGGGRVAGRHGGRHALRQAAGRGAGARAGAHHDAWSRSRKAASWAAPAARWASAWPRPAWRCRCCAGPARPFIEHGDPAKLLRCAGWTPPASSSRSAALRRARPALVNGPAPWR